jgi:outer membrane protein
MQSPLIRRNRRKNEALRGALMLSGVLSLAGAVTAARAQTPAAQTPSATAPTSQSPALAAATGNEYDLVRTVREALDNSYALQEARRTAQISDERANEAAAQGRPNVTGSASATRYDAPTNIAFGTGPPVEVLPDHLEQATIGVTQRLDLLGQIRAETQQARLQATADRINTTGLANQRALQAKTTYYSLLRAEHQVQVAEAALRSSEVQRDTARKLYEGEIGQKIDLLRAETQVATAQQDLTRAQNDRDIARAAFNDLVHRPLDAPVKLADVSGVTVGVDVTRAGVVGSETPEVPTLYAAPIADVNAIRIDQSLQTALSQRPEVLAGAVQVRASETGIRLARTGQEPTFELSASGNYYPTFSLQTPRDKTASITASVNFPFYDGGATKARVAQARLRSENAKTALEDARANVSLEVRQAYLNLSTAARQIDAANAALHQAIAARQLAQVRYEGQVGIYLEVTDAQTALVRAENAQVDAVYNYLVARAEFENALGTPNTAALVK